MITIGGTDIVKAFLGSTELKNIAIGDEMLLSSEPPVPLPYDAEVEYLEGTGTQWLDTGIGYTNGILAEYECSFSNYSTTAPTSIVSSTSSVQAERFRLDLHNTAYIRCIKGSTSKLKNATPRINRFYHIIHDTRNYSHIVNFKGTEQINEDTTFMISSVSPIAIFKNDVNITLGKIKWLKLTDNNGDLVLDWKAVRVGQVGYMYDNITGELHGNDGTGDFVLGNDIT